MCQGKMPKILVNEKGAEIPLSTIAVHDLKRHEVVTKAIAQAKALTITVLTK